MSKNITAILFSTNLLLSMATYAASPEAPTSPSYKCPPHESVEHCKAKAQEEFRACLDLVGPDEQEEEDVHGNRALPQPTQRTCEVQFENHKKECEENCRK